MIVLDTNVMSELMFPKAAPEVLAWLDRQERHEVYTTAITSAEIRYGLARLPDGARKAGMIEAGAKAFGILLDSMLPFDERAAATYGGLMAAREAAGRPIDRADAQIAATRLAHSAALATRNTPDFVGTGIELIDPWQQS